MHGIESCSCRYKALFFIFSRAFFDILFVLLVGIIPGLKGFQAYMVEEIIKPEGGLMGKCNFCHRIFRSKDSARAHVKNIHLVPEKYQCNLCSQVVNHRHGFSKHIIIKHEMKGVRNVVDTYAKRVYEDE